MLVFVSMLMYDLKAVFVDEHHPSECHGVLDVIAEQYCVILIYECFISCVC